MPVYKNSTATVFSRISPRYDLLNHVLSFNLDRQWRRELAEEIPLPAHSRILDACTGTADIAIELSKNREIFRIAAVDFSQAMLDRAQKKTSTMGLKGTISFVRADVSDLPFGQESFDAVSIGFGLRNLVDRKKGLKEIVRVLKQGRYAAIIEFSPPEDSSLKGMYGFYLKMIMPIIGGIISGCWHPYRYLASSVQGFIPPKGVMDLMGSCGLTDIRHIRLSAGIAHLYIGRKLP